MRKRTNSIDGAEGRVEKMMNPSVTRRTFVRHVAVAGLAAPALMPALARAKSPNAKPHLAIVGCGGRGWADIHEASAGGAAEVVAVCDVDARFRARGKDAFKNAELYTDWRKMLENKAIDGVMVATPDHMHAPISVSAMRAGKAVCCQKPLTHNIREARTMAQVAEQTGVVTHMGIQHHSGIPNRLAIAAVQSGAVGKITEVHVWTDRPGRFWNQPVDVPAGAQPVPDYLDWDGWLGVAEARPYHGLYHPFAWRGLLGFGTGAVGDMAIHLADPVYKALDLSAPTGVVSKGPAPTEHCFPAWSVYEFVFPGTQYAADNVKVIWYDGGKKPDPALAPGHTIGENGALYVGQTGAILHNFNTGSRRIDNERLDLPKLDPIAHYMLFTQAIAGEAKTNCPFSYSGPLTEAVLLGTVAARFPNVDLRWDPKTLTFPGHPDADRFVARQYRKGWEIDGLG